MLSKFILVPSSRGPRVGNKSQVCAGLWVEAWQARIERFRILRRHHHLLLLIVVVDETTTTNTKNTHFSIFVDDDIIKINKSEHIIALILVIGEVFETLLSYVV